MPKADIKGGAQPFNIQDIIIELLNSLSAVRALSELNPQAGNEKELISKALSVLIQNQDMERCSFFILNEDKDLVNLTGLSTSELFGAERIKKKSLTFKIGQGIIGLAALTGEIQYCKNCKTDARFINNNLQHSLDSLPGSLISVPVIAAKELIGVINISHPEAAYFSEWHIRLLHIYKNMMGELITNYRLLKKMEEQIAVRTKNLEAALDDIRKLKEYHESMSMRDELTASYNRRYFYTQIEAALARAKRYNQPLCLLVLDLDNFKLINDTYGHGFGDIVLRDVAGSIREEIRESDICVRFGGEEFVIVFTDIESAKGKLFAERIRQRIASLALKVEEREVKITASIGVYCLYGEALEQPEFDIDTFLHYADQALYAAKAAGRNRVVFFSAEMHGQ
ncbi:Diguanylate cyclase [Candidatus Methylobacter favarea]|uniref:diguanylate cyclase n=1 Tax=Candidatus Methylobacter favarea TaxID=2707345 RepID=A0A8S0WIW0_9GAMM|nr:sensor domain-containing diguanylate cyclase [Candidatus Methylobacter favarea]CAA9890834.1 Diguanylate cyclase [Candidatus Methylobacter favarea]